jgi:acetyl-CoA synthetase
MARGIWGDMPRFHDTYFNKINGVYFTGDGAKIDEDGDFIISGRIDDVINVAGHRLGTAEVESALVAHESVAEAAVVGIPDDIVGQIPVAFVVLRHGFKESPALALTLRDHVKTIIGSFAKPKEIHFEAVLPKTRSGKIMRRLLRARARGEAITTDLSTLDDATFKAMP